MDFLDQRILAALKDGKPKSFAALLGEVGWTADPKPSVALHDFIVGFEPQWRRKPLKPE